MCTVQLDRLIARRDGAPCCEPERLDGPLDVVVRHRTGEQAIVVAGADVTRRQGQLAVLRRVLHVAPRHLQLQTGGSALRDNRVHERGLARNVGVGLQRELAFLGKPIAPVHRRELDDDERSATGRARPVIRDLRGRHRPVGPRERSRHGGHHDAVAQGQRAEREGFEEPRVAHRGRSGGAASLRLG